MSTYYLYNGELYHYGIKGMKWGVRRYQNPDGSLTNTGKRRYSSTGIRAAMAKRSNKEVDKGFDKWKENAKLRDEAIALGKKAGDAKRTYESNKSDKSAKDAYKQANKEYKKALSKNTTYRKGVVRQEIGRDASRKYLSEARRIKKELDKDPGNQQLKKRYNELMSKHDIERADARRAKSVGEKRSRRKAAIKRSVTMTVKAAATTAAVSAGAYAVNRYLNSHNVTLNGKRVNFSAQNLGNIVDLAKKARNFLGYLY